MTQTRPLGVILNPHPLVAPLHPKAMPVILHESDYQFWLSGSLEEATKLAVPFPSQLMRLDNDPN